MPNLLVIQHAAHEGLGFFEEVFEERGCSLSFLRAERTEAPWPRRLDDIDGLVVMGGPMSVYEQARYPFLKKDLQVIQAVLKRRLPILGICLGAQLLAQALEAKVAPNSQKEIGWYPLMRESGSDEDPLFRIFGQTETVFQWHGDAFALPKGAVRLASSPLCPEQAFRYRTNAYGLQFHLEVTEAMIEGWMKVPGNQRELGTLRGVIDPQAIQSQNRQHLPRLQELAQYVAAGFVQLVSSESRAHVL